MTRRPAHGLNKGFFSAQETFLVGVENRYQRYFRHIQAFPQQVNSHQHIKFTQPQIADDLNPLHRIDIRVQITDFYAMFIKVFT